MGLTQSTIQETISSISEYIRYKLSGDYCYSAHIEDVGFDPTFLKGLRDVSKEEIDTALSKCEGLDEMIERIAQFIESYIDLEKHKRSCHSKSWPEDFVVPEDKEDRLAEIRRIVIETLKVSSVSKDDKTLTDYIYRLLSNLLESQLGGFLVSSDLPEGAPTPMQFLKEYKNAFLEHYIKSAPRGILFCPEHDQPVIENIPGVIGLRLFPEIHKGNMAKVVYFDERFTVRPLSHEDIQVQMVRAGMSREGYEDNEDRFAVAEVTGPPGTLFEEKTIIFFYHLKSVGARKDFESAKFKDIYRFIKRLQDSFKGMRRICMGDYNAPEFGEGTAHFCLTPEHLPDYPVRIGGEETDCHLTYGFTNVTTYPESHISCKERMTSMLRNSQSPRGKYGKRTYYTERTCVDIPEEVEFTSRLYPQPKAGERLVTPHCAGAMEDGVFTPDMETMWLSDHQVLETVVNGTPLGVFNTLSYACSTTQPFKDGLTNAEIKTAEREYVLIFKDLINMIMAAHKAM